MSLQNDTPKTVNFPRTLAAVTVLLYCSSMPNPVSPPVLVQVSDQRALGIMSESSTWEEFAWTVGVSKDANVLDEWDEAGARFVVIDWSGE